MTARITLVRLIVFIAIVLSVCIVIGIWRTTQKPPGWVAADPTKVVWPVVHLGRIDVNFPSLATVAKLPAVSIRNDKPVIIQGQIRYQGAAPSGTMLLICSLWDDPPGRAAEAFHSTWLNREPKGSFSVEFTRFNLKQDGRMRIELLDPETNEKHVVAEGPITLQPDG